MSWCPADNLAGGKSAQAPPAALARLQDGLGPASAAAPQLYSRKALPSAAQRSSAAHQQWVAKMRAHFAEVGMAFSIRHIPLLHVNSIAYVGSLVRSALPFRSLCGQLQLLAAGAAVLPTVA